MDDRERLEDNRTIYHKVKIGETLPLIARKYDVKAADIVAWNKLTSKKLKIGQRLMLILPEKAETPASELVVEATVSNIQFAEKESVKPVVAESGKPQAPKANKLVYRVKRGDSLSVIAKKYGKVTPEAIMLANNLKNDKLSIGQKLNIPLN
ncbi:LysM peptidoglycan-binding domain-containing protein [Viscerimonas tarda]